MLTPFISIDPLSIVRNLGIKSTSVDFPLPDGPTIAVIVLHTTEKETSLTASY